MTVRRRPATIAGPAQAGTGSQRWRFFHMPHVHDSWTVLPHGPLTEIDDGILTVTGLIHLPLVDLERRMTVVRLHDGSAIIYSAIALEDAEMKTVEAFATPRYLVVPNDAHRLDAKIYKQRYTRIRVLAPWGARDRVAGPRGCVGRGEARLCGGVIRPRRG